MAVWSPLGTGPRSATQALVSARGNASRWEATPHHVPLVFGPQEEPTAPLSGPQLLGSTSHLRGAGGTPALSPRILLRNPGRQRTQTTTPSSLSAFESWVVEDWEIAGVGTDVLAVVLAEDAVCPAFLVRLLALGILLVLFRLRLHDILLLATAPFRTACLF